MRIDHLDVSERSATGRIAMALPPRLSAEGWRALSQAELATTLHLDQSTVSRGLAELVRLGLVERQGAGSTTRWRLTGCSRSRSSSRSSRSGGREGRGTDPVSQRPQPGAAALPAVVGMSRTKRPKRSTWPER